MTHNVTVIMPVKDANQTPFGRFGYMLLTLLSYVRDHSPDFVISELYL